MKVEVEAKKKFVPLKLSKQDIDTVFVGNSIEKELRVIFHHEEILEDSLDTEYDIHFW